MYCINYFVENQGKQKEIESLIYEFFPHFIRLILKTWITEKIANRTSWFDYLLTILRNHPVW